MYRESMGQLTVAQLISELQKHPPTALVWCEESGPTYVKANRTEYQAADNSVTIIRCD